MIKQLYRPFQHWSKNGSVYILSDTHFNDNDCLLMDPNWLSPEEHIRLINKYVTKNDTLILLGDVGNIEYAKKLRGYKVLIKGNHDKGNTYYEELFDEVYDGPLFISQRIILSHEPIYGLDFCLNIHGHDHNPEHRGDATHINAASNVCGFRPFNLQKDIIDNGLLKEIKDIHRITIDNAIEHPIDKS